MIAEASTLLDQLVGAYRPYVRRVAGEHGWDTVEGVDAAVEAGAAWLEMALEELLDQRFDAQRRGPLEVFQEAMRFPSAALAAVGIPEVPRQAIAMKALPGDVYDLAPESSRLLGEDVWYAHLAWGAAKARAMAR